MPSLRCRLLLATIVALVPVSSQGFTPVPTAVVLPYPAFVPELTVVQEINAFGQLHYGRIVEEDMHLEAWLLGRCGLPNWRSSSASLDSCHRHHDGNSAGPVELCPGDASNRWSTSFPVNKDKATFGPHEAHLDDVPTEWLADRLVLAGEDLILSLAEQSGLSPSFVRSMDIESEYHLGLTFYMTCRRWVGTGHATKTHRRYFPIKVTYRGATTDGGGLVVVPQPPEQPRQPIAIGGLTGRTRIEQAHLMILPDDSSERCGLFLSGTFRTSGPTVVTYQLVDALEARSAQHEVTVDQSGVAFVSHRVDFEAGTGSTLGFAVPDSVDPQPQGGIAFAGALVDLPSDNLRGYYRIETISPHRSASNIASYNLEDCTAEQGPGNLVFDAVLLGDPDKVREALSGDEYRPESAD